MNVISKISKNIERAGFNIFCLGMEKYRKKLHEKGELYLRLKIKPGMAKNEIKGELADETLKINIAAIPEKGKANLELIGFLAKTFDVNKNSVKIISGKTDSVKLVKITQ